MKLEQQVCSLELAQKLKELGVKQESLFKWFISPDGWKVVPREEDTGLLICPSAFTVAELGEMLPGMLKGGLSLNITKFEMTKTWTSSYTKTDFVEKRFIKTDVEFDQMADTQADSLAKMLIYLLENKLITL